MRIISKKRLQEFWRKRPESESSLKSWYIITKKANWESLADTREDFPHANLAGVCTIFNISGNKYRLITKISYRTKKVFIRFILTHAEYDKGIYKNDCEC